MISFETYLDEVAMPPRKPVVLKTGIFKGQTNASSTKQIKDKNGNIVILSVGDVVGKRTVNINLNGVDYYFPWAGNSYKIDTALKNKSDVTISTSKGELSFTFENDYNGDMPILSANDGESYFHFNKFNVVLLKSYINDKVKTITQD